jgi:4-amino-4-deoxy-L-arabinose transferase-like glycosyltransferase
MRASHPSLALRLPPSAAVAAVTLAGLSLRLFHLGEVPLNFDEGATWYFAHQSFATLTGPHATLETNPPLFYLLEHIVVLLGGGPGALRVISVIAGACCIPVAGAIATRLGGRPAGLAAAALVATSSIGLAASQDARAYAMLTLASLLTILAVSALLAGRQAAGWWLLYICGALCALYLHNTAVLMVAAVNGLVLLTWRRRQPAFWLHWLAANAIVALGYMPWAPVVWHQSMQTLADFWIARPTLPDLRYAVMDVYAAPDVRVWQPLPDFLLLATCVAAVLLRWRQPFVLGLALVVVLGVPLESWVISQWRPILNGKTLLWLTPVFLIVVAVGWGPAGKRAWPLYLALLGVQLAGCIGYFDNRWDEAFPEAAALLAAQARPGDVIYLDPPSETILLDLYGWPRDRLRIYVAPGRPWFHAPGTTTLAPADIGQIATAPRLWLLTRASPAEHSALATTLSRHATETLHQLFGHGLLRNTKLRNLDLSLFVVPRSPCVDGPLDARGL